MTSMNNDQSNLEHFDAVLDENVGLHPVFPVEQESLTLFLGIQSTKFMS